MTSPFPSPSFSSPRNFPDVHDAVTPSVRSISPQDPFAVVFSPTPSPPLASEPYTPWSYPLSPDVRRERPTANGFRSIYYPNVGVLHYHSRVPPRLSGDSDPAVYLNPPPLNHDELVSRLRDLIESSTTDATFSDSGSSE